MTHFSDQAKTALEAARHQNGRFGEQRLFDQGEVLDDQLFFDMSYQMAHRQISRIQGGDVDDLAQEILLELYSKFSDGQIPSSGYAYQVAKNVAKQRSAEIQGSLPDMGKRSYERQALFRFEIDRDAMSAELGRTLTDRECDGLEDQIIADARRDYHDKIARWRASGGEGARPSSRVPRKGFRTLARQISLSRGESVDWEVSTSFDAAVTSETAARFRAVALAPATSGLAKGGEAQRQMCLAEISRARGIAPATGTLTQVQAQQMTERFAGREHRVAYDAIEGRLSEAELAEFLPHYGPKARFEFCELLREYPDFAGDLWATSVRHSVVDPGRKAA